MINTIIFDMDGTLIDCADWHRVALDEALKPYGFEITDEMHATRFNGLPTSKKLEMLGVPEPLLVGINREKQRIFREIAISLCKPVSENVQALRLLKERGYTLAVASNSIRSTVDLFMDLAGYSPFLTLTLSNQDVTRPKPDPEIYKLAMQNLGVSPHECLIAEDNFNGIAAAEASGATVMRVKSPKDDIRIEKILKAIRTCDYERAA